jgi:hypothetical protein
MAAKIKRGEDVSSYTPADVPGQKHVPPPLPSNMTKRRREEAQ